MLYFYTIYTIAHFTIIITFIYYLLASLSLARPGTKTTIMYLDMQINVLTCLGIFPPSSERWSRRAFIVYRTAMFVFMLFIAVTMGVQMVVAADLTTLARIIDIWTMFISGLYKWCYIAWFDREFADLNASLGRLQVQGSVARGQSARTFTADYLKRMRPITMWYMFSGLVASILIIANPLVNYPQM